MLGSPDRDVHACITPHLRPVRSLARWLVELSATIADLRDVRRAGDICELVTESGEYAQYVALDTATRRWALGMIIGETEVIAIHASATRSDPVHLVDELLRRARPLPPRDTTVIEDLTDDEAAAFFEAIKR